MCYTQHLIKLLLKYTERQKMIKLPEPAYLCAPYSSVPNAQVSKTVDYYTKAQMLQFRRDMLEEAAQVAVDAIAFNGGTIQMENHVRVAISKLQGVIQ
jgi:hypothetical protein